MKKYWIVLSLAIAIVAIVAYNRTATNQPASEASVPTQPSPTPMSVTHSPATTS